MIKKTIPVVNHTKLKNLPEKQAIDVQNKLAVDKRLFRHIASLSDAHIKKDLGNATGSIACSADYLIPQLFDSAPNCGMRILTTNLTDDEVSKFIESGGLELISKKLPAKTYFGTSIPLSVAIESFKSGSKPVYDYIKSKITNEVENTFEGGDLFKTVDKNLRIKNTRDLFKAVPPFLTYLARHRLGIMGATNSHYIKLIKVDKIYDEKQAKKFGLKLGQYLFYMHTGSGVIGRYIGYAYSPQKRTLKQNIEFNLLSGAQLSKGYRLAKQNYDKQKNYSLLGYHRKNRAYRYAMQGLLAAGNQGFANRVVLSENLRLLLANSIKENVNLSLLYDAPHILLTQENHYKEKVHVHRNGATRARQNEPVFLAPLEETFGYIGKGKDNNDSTFYSANHEIAKLAHTDKRAFTSNKLPETQYKEKNVPIATQKRTYNQRTNKRHANFAELIAQDIENNNIADMVARFDTIASVTYE